jgi:hypothetical protein
MELIKINKIMSKKAQFLHNTKKAKRQRLNAVYIKKIEDHNKQINIKYE